MSDNKNKPWELPLRQGIVTTLPIMAFVIDLRNDDNVIHQIELDLGKPDDRKYLGKITAWAVLNHYSVETMNKNDANGVAGENRA